jgi:hypothetical protein
VIAFGPEEKEKVGLYTIVTLPKQITALLDTVSLAWVCGLGGMDGVRRLKLGVVAVLAK